MIQLRYCYEISAEAGLAVEEDGSPAPCYTQYVFDVKNEPTDAVKQGLHDEFQEALAELLGIPASWIRKISAEEYDRMVEGDSQ
jgi:hypothetical protein